MSFKQWTAVVQIVTAIVVGVWLYNDAGGVLPASIEDAAERTLWAMGIVIVLNIVLSIVMAIAVSIARREEMKDERADERDKSINARGMRNAYFFAATGGLATLIYLAVGADPAGAPYLLFGALMLAGVADAVSRLIYYRVG